MVLVVLLVLCSCSEVLVAQPPEPALIERDLAQFMAGLASSPADVGLHHDAGLACLWLGRFGEASRHFRAGLAVASTDAELWVLLGKTERKIGGLGESARALRQAVSLQPNRFENWYQLGMTLSDLGVRGESIEAFERARGANPPLEMIPNLHLYIGVLAISNRDWKRVETQMTALRGLAPDKATILQHLRDLHGTSNP